MKQPSHQDIAKLLSWAFPTAVAPSDESNPRLAFNKCHSGEGLDALTQLIATIPPEEANAIDIYVPQKNIEEFGNGLESCLLPPQGFVDKVYLSQRLIALESLRMQKEEEVNDPPLSKVAKFLDVTEEKLLNVLTKGDHFPLEFFEEYASQKFMMAPENFKRKEESETEDFLASSEWSPLNDALNKLNDSDATDDEESKEDPEQVPEPTLQQQAGNALIVRLLNIKNADQINDELARLVGDELAKPRTLQLDEFFTEPDVLSALIRKTIINNSSAIKSASTGEEQAMVEERNAIIEIANRTGVYDKIEHLVKTTKPQQVNDQTPPPPA